MAGVVIGIIGVLGKGEKVQKQTRTKTDTIEAASELEQEKGMPTGSDDDRIPPLSVSLLWLLPHNTAAPSDML